MSNRHVINYHFSTHRNNPIFVFLNSVSLWFEQSYLTHKNQCIVHLRQIVRRSGVKLLDAPLHQVREERRMIRNVGVLTFFVILSLCLSLQADTAKLSDLPADVQSQLRARVQQSTPPGLHFSAETNGYLYAAPRKGSVPNSPPLFISNFNGEVPGSVEVTAGGAEYSIQLVPLMAGLGRAIRAGETLTYTTTDGTRLTYSFKSNGVKEDIVLSHLPKESFELSYFVKLDPALEVKLDPTGNLLVYGPESYLSGSVQAADEKSSQLLMKARQNAPKNNLLYIVPAPIVIDSTGKKYNDRARYSFNSNVLVIHVENLSAMPAPVTIDPSVTVTTSSQFEAGTNEGMMSFPTDAIARNNPGGGTLGAWSNNANFNPGRYAHSSVVYNNYIYIIGGTNGTTYYNDVWVAAIDSFGNVGSFQQTDDFATVGRAEHTSVVYNGFLYVIGGFNGGGLNEIRYSPINADGSVTSWGSTTNLTSARWAHTSVAYDGVLYVLGGADGVVLTSSVEYAPFHASGKIGSFTATTPFSATGRSSFSTVVYNNYLYVIGGYTGSLTANVRYAPINADHTVGTWADGTSLPFASWHHASVAADGYLYVIGGQNPGNSNSVYVALIGANGQLGNWQVTSSFSIARQFLSAVAYKGKIYMMCGNNGLSLGDVQVATINSPALLYGISQWTPGNGFGDTEGGSAVTYNGYLYYLGGIYSTGPSNLSQYAPLNADGTIGTWATTTPVPEPVPGGGLIFPAAIAHNGYMYIAGGASGGTFTLTDEVWYAPINADGTLGTWIQTTSYPVQLYQSSAIAYDGYLYMLGGTLNPSMSVNSASIDSGTGVLGSWNPTSSLPTSTFDKVALIYGDYVYLLGGSPDTLYYAKLLPGGALGTWNTANFPSQRFSGTGFIMNGYIYSLGGENGSSNPTTDVLYAPINPDGTVGNWTPTTSFSNARKYTEVVVHNGYAYLINGEGPGSIRLNDIQIGKINSLDFPAGVGAWTAPPLVPTARFAHAAVASNGYLYVMGGYNNFVAGGYLSDVRYAQLGADGSIGTWLQTVSLPGGRAYFGATAYNGRIYIAGGHNGSSLNDVIYATIQGNGTLDSWSSPVTFTNARYGLGLAAYNGYLYITGGLGTAPYHNDVQFAAIDPNTGAVGGFNPTTSFAVNRAFHASIAYNGYLYVIGGFGGLDNLRSIEYAPLDSANGQVGTWNPAFGLDESSRALSAFFMNGYLFAAGGFTNSGPSDKIQAAQINADGSLSHFKTLGTFPDPRAFMGCAVYNGYVYLVDGTPNTSPTAPPADENHFAKLLVPGSKGAYSKLIDFGTTKQLQSFSLTGTNHPGIHNFEWAYAPDDATAVLGSKVSISNATVPGSYGIAIADCARYFWTRFEIDDTNASTWNGPTGDVLSYTVSFLDGSPTITSITDANACAYSGVKVNYTPGGGSTNYRLLQDSAVVQSPYASGTTFDPRNGVSHPYAIRPIGGACLVDSASSSFADANITPAAPANSARGEKALGHVHMYWPPVSGTTSYNVKRCNAGAGSCTPTQLINTPTDGPNQLNFFDNVLNDGNNYWYEIESVNGSCVSCDNISSVEYLGHFANTGWMANWVNNGTTAGTEAGTGANQMEAIRILIPSCNIAYSAHVATIGWQAEVSNGDVAGTVGQGKQIEAIKIRLLGAEADQHICYRVWVENDNDWQPEVCDNAVAGTVGQGRELHAIQIRLRTY